MPLGDVSRVLATKRDFMFSFMEHYIFSQIGVPRTETISNLDNFNKMIDFCLRTRQRINREELTNSKRYFTNNFENIRNNIHQGNWENLINIIYSEAAQGVGQKIGSLILEVIIHYGEQNQALESKLFVPIDTHVQRIFTQCLGLNNVPSVSSSIDSRRYREFQQFLADNSADGIPRICFDYLWFVGKIFCRKTERNGEGYSRGYKLCSMCWIKEYCVFEHKWD